VCKVRLATSHNPLFPANPVVPLLKKAKAKTKNAFTNIPDINQGTEVGCHILGGMAYKVIGLEAFGKECLWIAFIFRISAWFGAGFREYLFFRGIM
jgi:hypothetical protein